jgi:hypothetical protein
MKKLRREAVKEALLQAEDDLYIRDTRHLLVPGCLDTMQEYMTTIEGSPVLDSSSPENICEVSKFVNMHWKDDRLMVHVQWATVISGIKRAVTEEDAVNLVHLKDTFARFYDYILRGPKIRRDTTRSQGSGRHNAGERDVTPAQLAETTIVHHDAHVRSRGVKASCMRDSIIAVLRCHKKDMPIDQETDDALHCQKFAINFLRSSVIDVRLGTNHLDQAQQAKPYHSMPEVAGVFLCIAMAPNNIKHGFVIDTRGEKPVLLDSSLPNAVEYTKESMSWVKSWQKIYRTTVKKGK